MRQIKPELLQDRKRRLLQAVIHHYIKTAKPVGSNVITQDYEFDLSPATIRNLMSELEEDGYLTHPHTSAGRIPTDKGYRFYVDSMIELQKLIIDEEEKLTEDYYSKIKQLEDILSKTSRALSVLSHYTGFVVTPKMEGNKLKFVEISKVSKNQLLAVFITHTGLVKHRIIEASLPAERLEKLNMLLNRSLRDLTLSNIKQRIVEILDDFEKEQADIISLAKNLSGQLFDIEDEIYLDGTSHVLELPEFHDYESMRCLLSLSEDKDRLLRVINENMLDKGVNVLIGSESSCSELQQLSVVSSIYKDGDNPIGILGVIGPKRMEYDKMMALVSAVSRVVNRLLLKV